MPSKRTGKSRSASEKRAVQPPWMANKSKRFQKDWDRYAASGRFEMSDLKTAMVALIGNDGPLPPERRDHALSGRWAGLRECHIHGDFVLETAATAPPARSSEKGCGWSRSVRRGCRPFAPPWTRRSPRGAR